MRARWASAGVWLIPILFAISPMFWAGLPPTADGILHVYRVVEAAHLLRWGVLYSRWAPDLALGYGYPLFVFHAPYFPWVTAWAVWGGLNPEYAVKLHLALLFGIGGLGMYRLARLWLEEPGAALATAAFLLAPFRIRDVYWQGNYPQFAAQAFMPWVLWSLHRTLDGGRRSDRLFLSLSYALLILSHNITAMLGSGMLLGYGLLLVLLDPRRGRRLPHALGALAMGLALAAFFWIPALAERPRVQLGRLLEGYSDFRRHFLPPGRLIAPIPLMDQAAGNKPEVLTVGLHQALLGLPSLCIAIRHPPSRRTFLALLVGTLVPFSMALAISRPLWEHLPLLAFAEFPWRWLGLIPIPLGLLIGMAAQPLRPLWREFYIGMAALALVWGAAPLLYPYGDFSDFRAASICDPIRYEQQAGTIGLTSAGELLPKTVARIPETPRMPDCERGGAVDRLDRSALPDGVRIQALHLHPLGAEYQVESEQPFSARFHLFAYEGWRLQVDGRDVPWSAEPPYGWLKGDLPPGVYRLSLRWRETPRRLAADLLSAVAWGAWGLGGAAALRRSRAGRRRPAPAPSDPLWARGAVGISMALGALWLVKTLYLDPFSTAVVFRIRTSVEAPWGMTHRIGRTLGDAIELIGYRLDPPEGQPGRPLRVTLYWRALRPLPVQYSSFAHLVDRSTWTAWAKSDHMHPADVPTTMWGPNYYYPDVHELQLPPSIPEGVYALRVGLYEREHPERLLRDPQSGRRELYLFPIWVLRPGARSARPVDPPIRFGDELELAGYRLEGEAAPNRPLTLWLFWRARRPLERNLTLFVHLLDSGGQLWAQWDGWPYGGGYPTAEWPPDVVIPVRVPLELPADLPPGRYRLQVGWYEWPPMRHLRVDGGTAWPLPLALEAHP